MNLRSASTFALALITGFGSAMAFAQEMAPARPTEVNAAAMRLPNPSALRPAPAVKAGSVMRPEAASFTEEQLRQITRLAPETSPQARIIFTDNPGTAPVISKPAEIPSPPIISKLPVETVLVRPSHTRYEITADDETLYLTLRRWTSEAGYQLVWSAAKDFPVKRTIYEAQDISSAIAQAMKDTEFSAYPLHACTYTNNVIRVLHVSQSCVPK